MVCSGNWHEKKVQVWVWKGGTLKRRLSKPEDFVQLEEYCTGDVTNISIHYLEGLVDLQEIERLRSCIQSVLRMADDAQYEIRQYAQAIYHEFVKPFAPIICEAWEATFGAP
jgi:hypothetical protein